MSKLKKNVEEVFGKTFKKYSKKEILDFVKPFKTRFKKNKINAKKLFKGKKCLDFGCGNGRGSLFMAMNVGKTFHAIDLAKSNIFKTKKVMKQFGYNINTLLSSGEKVPYKNGSFDFVWCNGVIMHTHKPSSVISEIYRVLKPNGKAWIYVYGSGGIWWCVINKFRKYFSKIKPSKAIAELKKLGYSNRYIAEFLDDWKVLNLRTYKDAKFKKCLKTVGFKKIIKLNRGLNYDTSEKLFKTKNKILFGDGDLRYIVKKNEISIGLKKRNKKILNSINISHISNEPKLKKYSLILDKLFIAKNNSITNKISIGAKIQYTLRKMTDKKYFNDKLFYSFLKRLLKNSNK